MDFSYEDENLNGIYMEPDTLSFGINKTTINFLIYVNAFI